MTTARSTVGVAVLNGRLYAVGGRDGSACLNSVECYDPNTNKWTVNCPMLKRRGGKTSYLGWDMPTILFRESYVPKGQLLSILENLSLSGLAFTLAPPQRSATGNSQFAWFFIIDSARNVSKTGRLLHFWLHKLADLVICDSIIIMWLRYM